MPPPPCRRIPIRSRSWVPACASLPLRWQRAVTALFLTGGNKSDALRHAGYGHNPPRTIHSQAGRIFADPRVRAAVREVALQQIDIAEPELLSVTLRIMRDTNEPARDRLRAVAMVWDRTNPVTTKMQIDVAHHLSTDERDIQHYRALQKLGAPERAFLDRFGHAGLARVAAMATAEELKQKQIDGSNVIDADYQEISQ
jgi:hypothetical protein